MKPGLCAIGAVLLAAGESRRFGSGDKLLAEVGGEPLLKRAAKAALEGGASPIVAVTGADPRASEAALLGLPVRFVPNAEWEKGIGGSIAVGVRALDPDLDGAFIVPGDMPFLTPELFRSLIAAFVRSEGRPVVFPTAPDGGQRNPVLWPRRRFPQLTSLRGPEGGKRLLAEERKTFAAAVEGPAALWDIDTQADLDAARAFLARRGEGFNVKG